jgi:two-component system NtrC family sensor kinase
MEHQVRMREIVLQCDIEPDLPAVFGSAALLQQVLTNLILNACQSMPTGGDLQVAAYARSGGVEIVVKDSGTGIHPEHLPRIFDPFFTTRPIGQGTGLGLAVSYSIVQQFGGVIEVQSRLESGSTFIVRLPMSGGLS